MPAAPTSVRTATCSGCGATFACGASAGECWCQEVDLAPAVRRRIAAEHADCLCRRCLAGLADQTS